MKVLPLLSVMICLLLSSCVSQRKVMDSWMGKSKQQLIETWGPPAREASNGGTGEILIYSSQFYNAYYNITSYRYSMFYADKDGTLYHWLIQTGTVPPQRMDVNLYVH